jgi:hypothetical protein
MEIIKYSDQQIQYIFCNHNYYIKYIDTEYIYIWVPWVLISKICKKCNKIHTYTIDYKEDSEEYKKILTNEK